MNPHFYKYDCLISHLGKLIEKHSLLVQSPIIATHAMLLDAAVDLLGKTDYSLEIIEVQKLKTKEEFIKHGGRLEGIVSYCVSKN